jgi:hypothetical protein
VECIPCRHLCHSRLDISLESISRSRKRLQCGFYEQQVRHTPRNIESPSKARGWCSSTMAVRPYRRQLSCCSKQHLASLLELAISIISFVGEPLEDIFPSSDPTLHGLVHRSTNPWITALSPPRTLGAPPPIIVHGRNGKFHFPDGHFRLLQGLQKQATCGQSRCSWLVKMGDPFVTG